MSDEVAAPANLGMVDQLVTGYIQLRDKKAALKAKHDAEMAPLQAMLDKIEVHLLTKMNEQGVKSYGASTGTAYISTRTSVTCADWESYKQFCVQQEDPFMFMERRVNKTAVDEYVAQNNDLPPGVNYRAETVVNVRRS